MLNESKDNGHDNTEARHARPRRPRPGGARVMLAAVAALAIVAVAVTGCGGSDSGSESGSTDTGPLKVGLLWPQSGSYSNYGPDGEAGVKLALKEGGMKVAGRKIELVIGNEDVLDPSQTLANAKTLVEQDGVKVMLGPVFGSSQQAVAPYFASHGVLAYSPYGTTLELAEGGAFVSWPSVDTAMSTPLGGYLYKTLGYHKIATIAPEYVYGENLIKGATKTFEEEGGKVVQQQYVPLGTTDLLPYASNLSSGVEAVVMWLVPEEFASFLKGYQSLGKETPLVLINGVFDPTFQEIGSKLEGTEGIMEWSLGLENPSNEKFVSAFEQENGSSPNNNNAAAYIDTQIMLADLEATKGSTDIEEMREALQSLNLETPSGPLKFEENGAAVTSRTIVKATKGPKGHYIWAPVKTFEDVPGS